MKKYRNSNVINTPKSSQIPKTTNQTFESLSLEQRKQLMVRLSDASRDKRPSPHELRKDEIHQEDLRKKRLENDDSQLSNQLKENIFIWVQRVVSIYLLFVGYIILLILYGGKPLLSDKVLIALLTTTTINILGLPFLIIRALFNQKKKKKAKNTSNLNKI